MMDVARPFSRVFNVSISDSLECVNKTGVKRENMAYIISTIHPENRETNDTEGLRKASCACVCLAKKGGYIADGEIQIAKFIDDFIESPCPEGAKSVIFDSAKVCKQQASLQTDECLNYYYQFLCTVKRSLSIFNAQKPKA
ncbi:uncharacterized protein LOC144472554 [Augochlora pura]